MAWVPGEFSSLMNIFSMNISLLLLVNFPLHEYFLYFARFRTKMGNWSQYPFSDQNSAKAIPFGYRLFSHDVTAAILGVEFFSYANAFFCSRKSYTWLISDNNPHDRTFTVMWKVLLVKAHLFDEIHGAIYYHSINQSGFLALLGKKIVMFYDLYWVSACRVQSAVSTDWLPLNSSPV